MSGVDLVSRSTAVSVSQPAASGRRDQPVELGAGCASHAAAETSRQLLSVQEIKCAGRPRLRRSVPADLARESHDVPASASAIRRRHTGAPGRTACAWRPPATRPGAAAVPRCVVPAALCIWLGPSRRRAQPAPPERPRACSKSRVDQGAGIPRPAGKAEEEPIAELWATTTTPPAGMRGPASRGASRQALGGDCTLPQLGVHQVGQPASMSGSVSGARRGPEVEHVPSAARAVPRQSIAGDGCPTGRAACCRGPCRTADPASSSGTRLSSPRREAVTAAYLRYLCQAACAAPGECGRHPAVRAAPRGPRTRPRITAGWPADPRLALWLREWWLCRPACLALVPQRRVA